MCGIIGYVGTRDCRRILLDGLRLMEYRGYDSAGIAVVRDGVLRRMRRTGTVNAIAGVENDSAFEATTGVGHTRWATHGLPSERNAHPHCDGAGRFAVVHNGIVENYQDLRRNLERLGHVFESETDSEVLPHLIAAFAADDPTESVRLALQEVVGSFGLVVIDREHPELMIAARRSSPLIVGEADHGRLVASDLAAIVPVTNRVFHLEDDEVTVLTARSGRTVTLANVIVPKPVEQVYQTLAVIDRGGCETFMEKEILEQPDSLRDLLRGRVRDDLTGVKLGGLEPLPIPERLTIVACGSSWHAALIGEYMIEELARIPVEVEYASEFRYRNPVLQPGGWVLGISQSGETADTLAALRLAKERGQRVLGMVNRAGSAIAREADAGMYLHAGLEFGVAATKTFSAQVASHLLLAVYLGRRTGVLSEADGQEILRQLQLLPPVIEQVLQTRSAAAAIARRFAGSANCLFLGRGLHFPIALEGALKLKEISYIHAEGYPAAEMKHGPIALIDQDMPVVFIALQDETYEKILGNIREVHARGGRIIALISEGDTLIEQYAADVIRLPDTPHWVSPLLSVIPLQWLAYHIARERGCNVDRPRNLAKSVTVE